MSYLSSNELKLGESATASQNFKVTTNNDGTLVIARADGSQTVLSVGASGVITAPQGFSTRQLGYAQITASQGSITTIVDITSLTVTVNVLSGQRVKVTAYCPSFASTVGTDTCTMDIWADGALIQTSQNSGANGPSHHSSIVLSPSAGSHTYKVRGYRVGTGTATFYAGATFPSYILAEVL